MIGILLVKGDFFLWCRLGPILMVAFIFTIWEGSCVDRIEGSQRSWSSVLVVHVETSKRPEFKILRGALVTQREMTSLLNTPPDSTGFEQLTRE